MTYRMAVRWTLKIHPEVRAWLHEQRSDYRTAHAIGDAIEHVLANGPGTGRPLVDTLAKSRLPNLKELRPGSSGETEVRILFLFDPDRQMVLLVAGDKAGEWNGWYDKAIPVAEARYHESLEGEW